MKQRRTNSVHFQLYILFYVFQRHCHPRGGLSRKGRETWWGNDFSSGSICLDKIRLGHFLRCPSLSSFPFCNLLGNRDSHLKQKQFYVFVLLLQFTVQSKSCAQKNKKKN